ncbi:hypothetical protein T492DRAFT_198373 [Pavlovales sp. CCMP2436]|nr:hypothetical protein T492DRAFT_198373 [Pavlovales sp. CCMP2436]
MSSAVHPAADELDQMVLTYLQERGFTESAAKLRDEAQVPTLPELTARLRRSVRSAVGSGLLFHSPGAICSLERCFLKLREWVDGSLEQYRRELSALLYPMFVRSFLELVHRGLPDEAAAFMHAYRGDFGGSAPELTALAALRSPAQVAESELAREYWAGAFELRLSAYSFELLVAFVQAEQLLPFLQLLNGEHFRVLICRRASPPPPQESLPSPPPPPPPGHLPACTRSLRRRRARRRGAHSRRDLRPRGRGERAGDDAGPARGASGGARRDARGD